MRHALRLLFCCLLSLIIGMEAFAWLCGFGLNVSLTVVCGICLLVLLIYSAYDILDVVDDLKFYKDKYVGLEENYNYACEQIKRLNDYVKEDTQEIVRLRKLLHY